MIDIWNVSTSPEVTAAHAVLVNLGAALEEAQADRVLPRGMKVDMGHGWIAEIKRAPRKCLVCGCGCAGKANP